MIEISLMVDTRPLPRINPPLPPDFQSQILVPGSPQLNRVRQDYWNVPLVVTPHTVGQSSEITQSLNALLPPNFRSQIFVPNSRQMVRVSRLDEPPSPSLTAPYTKLPSLHPDWSPAERAHFEHLHQVTQAMQAVSEGVDPVTALSRIQTYQQSLSSGNLSQGFLTKLSSMMAEQTRTKGSSQSLSDERLAKIMTEEVERVRQARSLAEERAKQPSGMLPSIAQLSQRATRFAQAGDAMASVVNWVKQTAQALAAGGLQKFASATGRISSEQLAIIEQKVMDQLIIASAGSGKSTVIGNRLLELQKQGQDVSSALFVSQTNAGKAALARQLERIAPYIRNLDPTNVQTINALAMKIVQSAWNDPSLKLAGYVQAPLGREDMSKTGTSQQKIQFTHKKYG